MTHYHVSRARPAYLPRARQSVYGSRFVKARPMTAEGASYAERIREALRTPERDTWAADKLTGMLQNLESYGSFASEKQAAFADALIARLDGTAAPRAQPERVTTDLGDFTPMVRLFTAAKTRHPKVSLRTDAGDIELSLAGPAARAPGTINVATPGGFGNNTFYGRVLTSGKFEASRVETPAAVLDTLRRFAADPINVVAEDGRQSGRCSLCRRPLTTPESVALGMGPVCRAKFFCG